MLVALFNLFALALDALTARWLISRPQPWAVVVGAVVHGGISFVAAALLGLNSDLYFFGFLQLLSWLAFVHLPAMLAVAALVLRSDHPRTGVGCAFLAVALVATAVHAFAVEPFRLQTTVHVMSSDSLDAPLTIALLADLQTDRIGRHERRALRRIMEAEPDLILLTGDYVQVMDHPSFLAARAELGRAMDEVGFGAPLGVVAVRGDVDGPDWPTLFVGRSGFFLEEESRRLELGPVTVTALDLDDSRSPTPPIEPSDRFHVVLGHDPRYALTRPPADLLVGGHTHGGQVRIPGFGPLLSLTTLPRHQAGGGSFPLPWGGTLVVSRGVGLERIHAPRLRFWCRPEVVIIRVLPGGDQVSS